MEVVNMENNIENKSYYSSLRGFRRAVPIIIATVAVFLAACLLSQGAGAVGGPVRDCLLGIFSYGAYMIPILMGIHALFYASDYVNEKFGARLGFSITALIVAPTLEYAICFSSDAPVFDPVRFYSERCNGGFVGGVIGFGLTSVIGFIGVIILCAAVLAIYATFYFADKTGAYGQAAKAFAAKLASLLTKVDDKIKDQNEKNRQLKEEQEYIRRELASEDLADDDFFSPRDSYDEVTVNLGVKAPKAIEDTPEEPKVRKRQDKPLDLSYGLDNTAAQPEPEKSPETSDGSFSNQFLGLDDSPENVFTKDFDPFNFATSERVASRPSSKAPAIEEELDDLTLYEMKANHMPTEREKRMMELERRKKEWLEKKNATKPQAEHSPASVTIENTPAVDPSDAASKEVVDAVLHKVKENEANAHSSSAKIAADNSVPSVPTSSAHINPAPAREPVKVFENTVPESVNAYTSYNTTKTTYTAPADTFTFDEQGSVPAAGGDATEDIAILISQKIAEANPAYARSANEMRTFTKVTASPDEILFDTPIGEPDAVPEKVIAPESTVAETAYSFDAEPTSQTVSSVSIPEAPASDTSGEIREAPKAAEIEFEAPAEEVKDDIAQVGGNANRASYERAAEFAAIMAGFNGESSPSPEFKAYTPPAAPEAAQPVKEETTLKVERSMLSPSPEVITFAAEETEKKEPEVRESIIKQPEPTVPIIETSIPTASEEISFTEEVASTTSSEQTDEIVWSTDEENEEADFEEDETEFSDDEGEDEIASEEEPEETVDTEEIPPEQQNPDVIKMREMVPFLTPIDERNPEHEKADATQPESATVDPAEDEEIDVPFDEPTVINEEVPGASTGLIVKSEVKEEPKKKKPDYSNYQFPPIDLLAREESAYDDNIQAEIQENADKLIETLASFGVTASIKGVDRGPRITRYEVVPAKGVKVSSILNLQDDIALNLAAGSIRMEAPIPGKSAVGIEIPNTRSTTVRLRNLLETEDFVSSKSKTFVCIGRDVAGQPVFGDISKMPHLLIAGATGMGKSVCINSLLISVLYKARPDEVKLIMIDPKQVEFTMYNGIPHLLVPVVSDPKQAAGSLMWAVEEMERRYNLLNPLCVRNIDAYNEKVTADPSLGEPMSRIIIVIDEFADLMLQVKDPVETLVMRIAQKARAAGIYLVIGTQRPSVNVITGVIKANVPSRISCKVMSNVDSKTVLDSAGAEKLLDRGDALYAPAGSPKPHRVQCAFVSDGEVEAIMSHLRQFSDGSSYDSGVMEEIERAAQKCSKKGGGGNDRDDDDDEVSGEGYLNDRQFLDAVEVAVNTRKISTSLIQRKLSVGYGKAAKFIDIMEDMGIVGEPNGSRPREVLLTPDEWREKLARATLD